MFSFSDPAAFVKNARIVDFYCSKKFKIKKYAPLRIPDISLENLVLILEFPEVGFGSFAISGRKEKWRFVRVKTEKAFSM